MTDRVQRLREDVAERLAQLAAAASETGSAVGEESRQRAAAALEALRGQRRRRWRWLVAGAALGFVAGVTVAGAARRNELPLWGSEGGMHGLTETARQKARAATEAVQEKTGPVREAAQDAAAKAREKLPGSSDDATPPDKGTDKGE